MWEYLASWYLATCVALTSPLIILSCLFCLLSIDHFLFFLLAKSPDKLTPPCLPHTVSLIHPKKFTLPCFPFSFPLFQSIPPPCIIFPPPSSLSLQ